jgi:class 3 adenylate cyclase/tetratricopeptide (TPR) repeat protein
MSEVRKWLQSIGLDQYADAFAANDIDMDLLKQVDDQMLKDIGVASAGHRLRVRNAIAKLSPAPVPEVNVSTIVPTHETTAASAERRQLTVMFCDLVGSTALSARLDPEDLRGIIAAYHRCSTELVERNSGFVAKYMGDGVLAYFGYPQAHEHDAERAVRAGLALVEAVPKLATNAGSPLQVRVGIATGLVVVGDLIGAGAAQEQAVVGETPNLAARLQALAEPGAVVIASSTRRLTGGLFEYRDLGTVPLKGFAENVPAWQVLGAGIAESRFEALRATTTPLVGRDEEIDLLMRRWEQAKRGDGCVVLISGEPGIGKSRIAQAVVERLSPEPHTRLRYFCSPHHQDSAFYPSITQLERAAGFRRDDTDEQRLAKLEGVLAQGTNDLSEALPLLADLLSVPIGDRYPPLNLTPQKRKEKTLYALLAQVEGLADQQPVLMVWEDVHWSDPTTRESLDLLIDRVPTLRVLVIITFRPEFTPPWIGRPHLTLLSLSRLPPPQRAEMIKHVTRGKVLPKEIADKIVDRTDGVPLFIEELTKTIVESGMLTEAGNSYAITGPVPPLAIPMTLHASLLARLDRLAPTREVAQIGAALGRQFSHELISAVATMPKQQLDDALAQLVDAELIFRRGTPPDAEYTFKHALVQDAAYSTLLRSRRRQLHSRIAATLEEKFPEIVGAQPQFLAHHCAEAGLDQRAVEYWLKAGQQAVARSAMMEAEAQLDRGLNLLSGLPANDWRWQQELDFLTVLGPALIVTRGYSAPDVGKTYARARQLAEQLDKTNYLAPLLFGQWSFHGTRSENQLALSLAAQIEHIGRASNDPAVLMMGQFSQGTTRFFLGEFDAARALFQKCCGAGDPENGPAQGIWKVEEFYAPMLSWLSLTLTNLGHLDQGRIQRDIGIEEARRQKQAPTLVLVLALACWGDWVVNQPHEGLRHAGDVIALSEEHGIPLWGAWGNVHRGWSLAALGKAEEGLASIAKGLSMYRATGAVVSTPFALTVLADAHAKLGHQINALNLLTEGEKIIETTQDRYSEAELHRLHGDLLKTMGDLLGADQIYRRAIAVAQRQNAMTLELRAATSLARLWLGQGKCAEASDLLAPVYGWFTEGFDTPVLQDAKALLDELA